MMQVRAPAKVNLWLHVFPPDATGYHPLDTLFCSLELADEMTIDAADRLSLDVRGADVGPVDRNLAYRAAVEFYRASGLPPRAAITLLKNVPAGAGLGGGSSDAAAVLRSLNELSGHALTSEDLLATGARLGSDVAFFLCGSSLAHATGRGEILRAFPSLPRMPVLVIVPAFAISTADAYHWLDEEKAWSSSAAPESAASWESVARRAHNDFEVVVFRKHPVLSEFKQALVRSGAMLALLAGSGATLFGVYEDDRTRDGAAAQLAGTVRAHGGRIISTYSQVV